MTPRSFRWIGRSLRILPPRRRSTYTSVPVWQRSAAMACGRSRREWPAGGVGCRPPPARRWRNSAQPGPMLLAGDTGLGLRVLRGPAGQPTQRTDTEDGTTSPSATASGAPNRLLCPDSVRHMSVINRLVEHATVNCDDLCRRLERVVDTGLVRSPCRSAWHKRMRHRSVRKGWTASENPARAHLPC